MWILPKQLHTSRFVADMTELGLDSEEFGQMSEKSLMWRSKLSQQRTWSQRWKRESWVKHLSGRILRRSRHGDFEDAWTSSVLDSRASRSLVQEQEQPTTIPDTSGPMSDKQLDLFDQGWLCLKTSKESSAASSKEATGTTRKELQYCSMSLESWKEQVIAVRGAYSQRVKSGQATSGSGCSSSGWPTPKAQEPGWTPENAETKEGTPVEVGQRAYDKETGSHRTWGLSQATQVVKNWATPNTMDYMPSRSPEALQRQFDWARKGRTAPANLREQIDPENWPTPQASEGDKITGLEKQDSLTKRMRFSEDGQQDPEKSSTSGKSPGQLNPDWVEQLMGLPVGWTQLPIEWTVSDCSEMELCQEPANEQ